MDFLYFLAQFRTPAGNFLFQAITLLGQEVFVVAVICWLFWCRDKKLAYTAGFAYFLSGILVQGLKITFRIPRPWVLDPGFSPVPSAVPGATGYSFPSGHTQSVAALFGTFGLRAEKPLHRVLCFVVIGAVLFSRMYLGVHTPADVSAAFLLTVPCVLLNYFYIYKKNLIENPGIGFSAAIFAVSLMLAAYALLLIRNGSADPVHAEDCLKAAGAGAAFALGFFVEKRHIRFSMPKTLSAAVIRLAAGLAGTLVFLKGLKPILGTSLPAGFLRYFVTVLWVVMIYPLIFTGFGQHKKELSARR